MSPAIRRLAGRPGVGEYPQHRRVLRQRLGGERLQAALPRLPDQVLEQQAGDAAAVHVIRDGERDLRHTGLPGQLVGADADQPAVLPGQQRRVLGIGLAADPPGLPLGRGRAQAEEPQVHVVRRHGQRASRGPPQNPAAGPGLTSAVPPSVSSAYVAAAGVLTGQPLRLAARQRQGTANTPGSSTCSLIRALGASQAGPAPFPRRECRPLPSRSRPIGPTERSLAITGPASVRVARRKVTDGQVPGSEAALPHPNIVN